MNLMQKLIMIVAMIEGAVFAFIAIKFPDKMMEYMLPVMGGFLVIFIFIIFKFRPSDDDPNSK